MLSHTKCKSAEHIRCLKQRDLSVTFLLAIWRISHVKAEEVINKLVRIEFELPLSAVRDCFLLESVLYVLFFEETEAVWLASSHS